MVNDAPRCCIPRNVNEAMIGAVLRSILPRHGVSGHPCYFSMDALYRAGCGQRATRVYLYLLACDGFFLAIGNGFARHVPI